MYLRTKKRNRVDSYRLNNVAFIQFNWRMVLGCQEKRRRSKDVLLVIDDSRALH